MCVVLLAVFLLLTCGQGTPVPLSISYKVQYDGGQCDGVVANLEVSVRERRPGEAQFNDWHMLSYHIGDCDGPMQAGNVWLLQGSIMQLRFMMAAGRECHCFKLPEEVSFTIGQARNQTFRLSELLYSTLNDTVVCANNTESVIVITHPLILEGVSLTRSTDPHSSITTSISSNAIIVNETFAGTCPEEKTSCLPLLPISYRDSKVAISFKLKLGDYAWCRRINYPNEGVLLAGILSGGSSPFPKQDYIPLLFTRPDLIRSSVNQEGTLFQLSDFTDDSITLTTSSGRCGVASNILSPFVHHLLSVDANDMKIFDKDLRLSWIQSHVADHAECDIWTLSGVRVAVTHEGHTRHLLQENFTSRADWDIINGSNSSDCGDHQSCVLMDHGSSCRGPSNRQVIAPPLDLRVIQYIDVPGISPMVPACGDEAMLLLTVSFLLQTFGFKQAIPETDTSPQVILLSLATNNDVIVPVAYYTPMANGQWSIGTGVPLYHTSNSQLIQYSTCIDNATSSIRLMWSRNGTVISGTWSLSHVTVWSGSKCVYGMDHEDIDRWSFNHTHNDTDDCSAHNDTDGCSPYIHVAFCGASYGVINMSLNDTGNCTTSDVVMATTSTIPTPTKQLPTTATSTSPTAVLSIATSTTIKQYPSPSSTSHSRVLPSTTDVVPQPTNIIAMVCVEDGLWPATPINDNATAAYCYNGTINATRHCRSNASWEEPYCLENIVFTAVMDILANGSINEGLQLLHDITESVNSTENLTPAQIVYLLVFVVSGSMVVVSEEFSEIFIDITDNVIAQSALISTAETRYSTVSQLLITVDEFVLTNHNPVYITVTIGTMVMVVTDPENIPVSDHSISFPTDIFAQIITPVKVGIVLYNNLSSSLSPEDSTKSIISPVISIAVNHSGCVRGPRGGCVISNLSNPVEIVFNLQNNYQDGNLTCVFWRFVERAGRFPTGEWSSEGCVTLRSDNRRSVTCECSHLTHFAILLSPGVTVDPVHAIMLRRIGYVLVSMSLLGLALTIVIYISFKSLWSMRNYIHIMVCTNLFLAHLLFVTGVTRTSNPQVCSGIAVVLQYLFLVTFMWMLMEGVVLYIALVRVFYKHKKRYIIAFTIISYGVPAIYMAAIVPIGFLVGVADIEGHSHYLFYSGGVLTACWVRYDTHFIWSFIAPVIIITGINCCFFVMAIVIMRRHRNRQKNTAKIADIKYWLKSGISLTIVMGIGWIANILFFDERLIFIAYIMTAFMAGQGIIIFILLVPLSKHFREGVAKWWRVKQSQYDMLRKISIPFTSSSSTTHKKKEKSVENVYCNYQLGTFGNDMATGTLNLSSDTQLDDKPHPLHDKRMAKVDTKHEGSVIILIRPSHKYQ